MGRPAAAGQPDGARYARLAPSIVGAALVAALSVPLRRAPTRGAPANKSVLLSVSPGAVPHKRKRRLLREGAACRIIRLQRVPEVAGLPDAYQSIVIVLRKT
jgi:hypothetical protein